MRYSVRAPPEKSAFVDNVIPAPEGLRRQSYPQGRRHQAGAGQRDAHHPPTQPRPPFADHHDAVRPRARRTRSACAAATLLTAGKPAPCGRSALMPSRPQPSAATIRGVSSSDRTGRPQDARRSSHCPSGRVARSRRCHPKKTGGARASLAGGTPEGASPGVDAGRTPPPDPLAGHANRQADLPPTAQSARHNRQSGKAQLGYRRNFPIVRSISVPFSLAKTDRAPGNRILLCASTKLPANLAGSDELGQ